MSVAGASADGGGDLSAAAVAPEVRYVGLATRGIAFAIDAAIINVIATIVGIGGALIVGTLHFPKEIKTILAAVGAGVYVLWLIGYFVVFWSTAGQTPGGRIMRLRVVAVKGERIKPRRALLRWIGLVLSALPLFAGFLLILVDDRRRGFLDRLARTVVVEAPDLSIFEQRRQAKLEASILSRNPRGRATVTRGAPPPLPPPPSGRSPLSGDEVEAGERQG